MLSKICFKILGWGGNTDATKLALSHQLLKLDDGHMRCTIILSVSMQVSASQYRKVKIGGTQEASGFPQPGRWSMQAAGLGYVLGDSCKTQSPRTEPVSGK